MLYNGSCVLDLVDTQNFFISPPPPQSCLFLVLWFVFFIALTFPGNTCLMKVWVCICIGFSEFHKPTMCKISHSHFSPSSCLYFLFEESTAHISCRLRFAILWVDWRTNVFICPKKNFFHLSTIIDCHHP